MKFTLKSSFIILFTLLILFLSIGVISASDNIAEVSDIAKDIDVFSNDVSEIQIEESNEVKNTTVRSNNIKTYYGVKTELISYLKDDNSKPLKNKKLTIFLNGKSYTKTTDAHGKVVLNLNLKPNTYNVNVKFKGDSNYSSSYCDAIIKVLKAPVSLKVKDYSVYYNSDLFFKTKVINKVTGKPLNGIKVLFKVYSGKKLYKSFYATTDNDGVAALNKNLNVGIYRVHVSVAEGEQKKNLASQNSKSTSILKIKPTAEMGCCSFYLQVSSSEGLTGFRRDSTYSVNINIKPVNWYGRTAIKQYKTISGYSFHSIITSNGWMIGTGGLDGPNTNKAIERLAGEMVKSGSIQSSKLKAIRSHIASLGSSLGHFAIKAPNGKYAIVWVGGSKSGKLNPGEYICVPNSQSYFRSGKYSSFGSDQVNAAVKIAATDYFGINRREITVFHWKATTNDGSTTSLLKAYAANDNGNAVGGSTGYLKDDVYFKNKFYSKDIISMTPNKKYLGYHNFGRIDKFKTQTIVTAPVVTSPADKPKTFKIIVQNKANNKLIHGINIKVKVFTGDKFKTYTFKTNRGVVMFNTTRLSVGTHKVVIFSGNANYYISKSSKIVVVRS